MSDQHTQSTRPWRVQLVLEEVRPDGLLGFRIPARGTDAGRLWLPIEDLPEFMADAQVGDCFYASVNLGMPSVSDCFVSDWERPVMHADDPGPDIRPAVSR